MTEIKRISGSARMSNAIITNGTIYLKGVTPQKDAGTTVGEQTVNVLAQIDELLATAGTSRDRVVQVTIWLKDIRDMAAMNDVYDQWIVKDCEPVRACVQAQLAQPYMLLEIRVIAVL